MKLLLLLLLPVMAAHAAAAPDVSLAPFRAAAHDAFAAEMAPASQAICANLVAPPEYYPCLDKALRQSEAHLAAYRAALLSSIKARNTLFGGQAVNHFQVSERAWDVYSTGEVKAATDLADTPELAGDVEGTTRIQLIRAHMQMLDKIYYTLLHSDCGACLVNQ